MAATAKVIAIEPSPLEKIIHEGRMEIGADLARRILDERVYERQRPVAKHGVALWAEMLRRKSFHQDHQIWFGLLNGRLHLIDGQHRLRAVAESGVQAAFQVMIWNISTEADLHEAYTCFDRVGRPRSLSEVLNAHGISEMYGLTKGGAREVFRAALLIRYNFDPPHQNLDPIAIRNDQERLKYAEPLWAIAAEYEKLIRPAPATLRKRLFSSQVLAVALLTLIHQHELAVVFWRELAKDDGLRTGDGRKTLLKWLGEHMFERMGYNGAVAATLAWNAFYEHRSIETLKVGSTKGIRIAGTPVRGRGA